MKAKFTQWKDNSDRLINIKDNQSRLPIQYENATSHFHQEELNNIKHEYQTMILVEQ